MQPTDIIDTVCRALELDVDKLKSKTSVKEYVHGRFIICYLIREQGNINKELDLNADKLLKSKIQVRECIHDRLFCRSIKNVQITNRITKNLASIYSYSAIANLLGRTLKSGEGDHPWALNGEFICTQLLKIKDKEFCAKYEKVRNSMIPFVSPMAKPHK